MILEELDKVNDLNDEIGDIKSKEMYFLGLGLGSGGPEQREEEEIKLSSSAEVSKSWDNFSKGKTWDQRMEEFRTMMKEDKLSIHPDEIRVMSSSQLSELCSIVKPEQKREIMQVASG